MKETDGYCAIWKSVLAHKHPDELSPPERKAFDRHLVFCSDCSAVLAEEQEMILLVHKALSPKKSLPSWDELVRAYTDSHSLSLPQRRMRATISFATRIFDIEEIKTTYILKENREQFIDGWPPLFSKVGGTVAQ